MTRLLIALLATTAATPALAQHGSHAQPPAVPAPRSSTCTPEHAAMGHCTMAPQPPETDPHAGHAMPAQQADPHAGHQMGGHEAAPPAPPVGPPPAAAFSGPEHAADTVFGSERMEPARREMIRMHGRMATSRFRAERLEFGFGGGEESYAWEADFFIGEPLDRLWIKTEGEGALGGDLHHGEVQALWGRAISPFFDLQAGLRYDFAPDPERAHLVLGVQGTAPHWIEIDAAAFLSDEGELTARIEAEYDLRITQRLILQPLVEVGLSAQGIPELGIGAGLSTSEAGLRLRYEIAPEFAPYVGLMWERSYGATADFREAAGEEEGALRVVAGVRLWF